MGKLFAGAGVAEIRLPDTLTPNHENFVQVLDPLHVRVVLMKAEKSVALVSMELTSMMGGIDELRNMVGTLTGTESEYVWITVTHTFSAPHIQAVQGGHGGPGGPGGPQMSPEEKEESRKQTEALLTAISTAARQAAESLQEAKIGYGVGACDINSGRDIETVDGWWLGEGSTAYSDKTLNLIRLDTMDGRPIAFVYNYAVQSSVLDHVEMPGGGYVVSSDVSGAASTFAEKTYPEAVALFLCGAAGDQAPKKKGSTAVADAEGRLVAVERGEEAVAIKEELGQQLGEALCQLIENTKAVSEDIVIAAERRFFAVPAKVMPDRSEVRARKEIVYQENGFTESGVELLRVGDAVLVGVKPELTAAIGEQIRKDSAFPYTFVATMVNGGAKYMPDEQAFERITYAAQNGPFASGAAEILKCHAAALIREMAGQNKSSSRLCGMKVLNEVLGDGAVNHALVLEYREPISSKSVGPETFEVQGRTVLRAYASNKPEVGEPGEGDYVILELAPVDILERVRGRNEHINIHYHSLAVRQCRPVTALSKAVLPQEDNYRIAVENYTPVVEDFRQFVRGKVKYNLFVPKEYDPTVQYPLVLFLHDAGCNGSDPLLTLLQGGGAVGFASPESQKQQPCFVLAPQLPAGCRMTTDEFTVTPELEEIMDTVQDVMNRYSIDPKRVLTTGQSMGCMASCELLIRYPEFFAGAMLVAGQWSPEGMAEKALHNHMWILVSAGDRGAYPGMNAVTAAMESAGAGIQRYQWDGRAGKEALEAMAGAAAKEAGTIKYTVFEEDSVKTEKNAGPGGNHGGTWALVYTIDALRQWLLDQRKSD